MNRRDAAETDEDGGGGDGESFSAGEVLKAGLPRMVAMASQQMKQVPVPVVHVPVVHRNFLVNSEMRSSNLGIAAIALSKYVLGMVYCGAGE